MERNKVFGRKVRFGSWLCENAKTPDGDRRSYSSKTVLALKRASVLNLESELKNVILTAFRSLAFSHSQGQTRTLAKIRDMSASPQRADIPNPTLREFTKATRLRGLLAEYVRLVVNLSEAQ
jgi:hypothetical protein